MSGYVAGMNKYVASIGHTRYEVDPTVFRRTMPKAFVFSGGYTRLVGFVVFPWRFKDKSAEALCNESAEATLGCL
jgi:hypothetical protein